MRFRILLVFLLFCPLLLSAQAKFESAAVPETLPDAAKQAVVPGYRVVLASGKAIIEVFPAAAVKGDRNGSQTALYPDLPQDGFLGVLRILSADEDFRGQRIAPGFYTMRYQTLPADANHMGVAPNPDFVLLTPIASDSNLASAIPYAKLVKLSAAASKTAHPAAFSLATASKSAPHVDSDDAGHVVLTFPLALASGTKINVGLVVYGSAQ